MPRTPIHPCEQLAEELHELGMTAAELSRQIDVPVNRITGIINGQRGITADTALRLGHWFGTSPQFWMNLQQQYELRLAEKEVGAKVFGIVGRDGGYTKQVADACVLVPTVHKDRITPHTEGLCAVVWHLLVSHPALQIKATKWESTK